MDLESYRSIVIEHGGANDVSEPVILSASDHDGRILLFRLWDGAQAADPTGLTARLLFNSDPATGSGGYVTMTQLAGEPTATWSVPVPSDALDPGRAVLAVEVSDGTEIVASRRITAFVERGIIDPSAPAAQDALEEFRAAVATMESYDLGLATTAEVQALFS